MGVSSVSSSSSSIVSASLQTSSDSDISTLEQEKADVEKQIQKLKAQKNASNDATLTQLEKKKQTLEQEIAKLKSQGSTQTSSTKDASATKQTSKADQDAALLEKMGSAYKTDISQQGYDALSNSQQQEEE